MSTTRSTKHHHPHPHYDHPSFSSSLLEEIYRSFDHDHDHNHDLDHRYMNHNNHRMKKSNSSNSNNTTTYLDRRENKNNRFILDHWIKTTNSNNSNLRQIANCSSSTSSSDSSSGIGGFSSSDSESLYGFSSKLKQKSPIKPIRTIPADFPATKKKKNEGNLHRKAIKFYGDLKKVKQPISPGGKLSSFLNSIFNSNTLKKIKTSSSSNSQKFSERESPATLSTASRSCLSKTPSSAGKFETRSVRFAVAGDDVAKEFKDNRSTVEEVAKELLKSYQNRKELTVSRIGDNGRKFKNDDEIIRSLIEDDEEEEDDDDDDDDDDDVSCCSSDLFELENLLDIGVSGHRYREELPVFETTDLSMSYR